ncbi:MAG TPA: flagellin [Verrucomicrobiae bacterium]|nr:flagellin [Verrucomicrobiae bacterium]
MRVTSSSIFDSLIYQINRVSANQQKLENEATTGLAVQNPSDNPGAMRSILDLEAESSSVGQYQANITQLQQQASTASSAMQSLQTILSQASTLATEADGTKTQSELNDYATQVTQLIQEAAQAVNTQFNGNYLFGGTLNTQAAPYVVNQDSSGNVTSVTYKGNTSVPSVEIAAGVTMSVLPVGENTTGSGPSGLITDSRTGADLFNHLISLQNDLLSGNTTAISGTDLGNLQKDSDNITQQIATNGAVQQRMTAEANIASAQSASLSSLTSSQADADLATVMTQLTQTQTAYQAAVQATVGFQDLQMSILSFLQ